jgi:hypothetical protein
LSYNWNVYKVFKNGRRAKTPFHMFEYDDIENVREYFNERIKENFTEKLRASKLLILRSDLPQGRQVETDKQNKKNLQERKNRVFRKHLKNFEKKSERDVQIVTGLIFCKESKWKWQWALLESGTSHYIHGISPPFISYNSAHAWLDEEIKKL